MRYIPQLTRFYASAEPNGLKEHILDALTGLPGKIKYQERSPQSPTTILLRVGGYDARREPWKGFIEIEPFPSREHGMLSLCIMKRDLGNPISWKQLWKALVNSPELSPIVLRKRH